MKKAMRWLIGMLLVSLILLLSIPSVFAQVPNRPQESTVLDETNSLSQETIQAIDDENKVWKTREEQLQVGVYMTNQLSGDIESLANEVFRNWQIGFAGTDNGVLVVIALEDRKFRIETSDKAATVLTDVASRRILEDARSFFQQGDYDGGVRYIVDAIGDSFYGTNQARTDKLEERYDTDEEAYFAIPAIFILIIMFIIMKSGGRGGRGGGGGNSLLWMLLNSSSGSSSHSGSSGFGGGGWSGGGGGGGGASSGW